MKRLSVFIVLCAAICFVAQSEDETKQFPGWSPLTIATGSLPQGFKCKPMVDKKIGTWLKLSLGGSTDAIVKLRCMKGNRPDASDPVARIVYLSNGSTYLMENIPEGIYYVEAAYGNLYYRNDKQKKKCRFMEDCYFVRLKEMLDFSLVKETLDDGRTKVTTPRYELTLQLNINNHTLDEEGVRKVENMKISEEDFYR